MSPDKRPPANLPPVQKRPGAAPVPRRMGKGKGRWRKQYAREYAAGILHAMAEKLHPAANRRKKG